MKIHLIHPDFKLHILPLEQLVKEMVDELSSDGEIVAPTPGMKMNLDCIPNTFKATVKKGEKILYIHNETSDLGTLIDLVKSKTLKFKDKLVEKNINHFGEDHKIPCAEIELCDKCIFVGSHRYVQQASKVFVGCDKTKKGFCFGHCFNISKNNHPFRSVPRKFKNSFNYFVEEHDWENEYDEYQDI